MSGDPLAHVAQGFHRFRRYAPRMLQALEIEAAPVANPLMAAANLVGKKPNSQSPPTTFLRRTSKWHRHMNHQEDGCTRLWEVAVLFHLRDAFRSGDVWLRRSRRYADLKQALVPIQAAQASARLVVPFDPEEWLVDRRNRMDMGLKRLAKATRDGAIPYGSIENGLLHIDRLTAKPALGADELLFDLYRRMPAVRITDILIEGGGVLERRRLLETPGCMAGGARGGAATTVVGPVVVAGHPVATVLAGGTGSAAPLCETCAPIAGNPPCASPANAIS